MPASSSRGGRCESLGRDARVRWREVHPRSTCPMVALCDHGVAWLVRASCLPDNAPSMEPLPYDVVEAMIQCFGRCFHYKDGLAAFMLSAGVKRPLVDKYRHEMKYPWSRHLLADLAENEGGCVLQRKLLGALCQLKDLPDAGVKDRDAGIAALRTLKQLALERDLIIRKEKQQRDDKARSARAREQLIRERATKLETLRSQFNAAVMGEDRQAAGYSLEHLLKDLFALFEIEYTPSFRTPTQQIDGHFRFDSFDYLVEAKWRKDRPTEGEIGAFQRKVNTKLQSTRGLFVSIPGFRAEVAEQFNGQGANLILMDGTMLVHVLEGRHDLRDLLSQMIEAAVQQGVVYMSPM